MSTRWGHSVLDKFTCSVPVSFDSYGRLQYESVRVKSSKFEWTVGFYRRAGAYQCQLVMGEDALSTSYGEEIVDNATAVVKVRLGSNRVFEQSLRKLRSHFCHGMVQSFEPERFKAKYGRINAFDVEVDIVSLSDSKSLYLNQMIKQWADGQLYGDMTLRLSVSLVDSCCFAVIHVSCPSSM